MLELLNAHFASLYSRYFITKRLRSFALFVGEKGYQRLKKSKVMTRKEFIKYYNCIAEHSRKSIAISQALSEDLLEGGCIVKYGGKLETVSIELLAKVSGIYSNDIADLLYEGEVVAVEPGSIVRTIIKTPEELYDYFYNLNTSEEV